MRNIKLKPAIFLIIGIVSYRCFSQDSQGFFLNDFQSKKAYIPSYQEYKKPAAPATVNIMVDFKDTLSKVSKYLFGNNSNPYMTQIVTQPDLIRHIKTLSPNIIRYPGGNLSNVFFWDRKPGEKPLDVPDTIEYGDNRKRAREYFWYGKDDKPFSLSLDNYYKMLEQTHSTGIICVNAGYARYGTGPTPVQTAAHYAAEWVRYDKGRTKYWELGNEDYGTWQAGYAIDTKKNKDGQPKLVSGELYGANYKIFADSMHAAAKQTGTDIHLGATIIELPKNNSWDNEIVKNWNKGFFKKAGNAADFFVIHSYYTPWEKNSNAPVVMWSAVEETKKMGDYMKQMCLEFNIIPKPVAFTEWNIFAEGSKQQISHISGIHAAMVLGELVKNKFGMASRWNLANGYGKDGNDHGLFSKGDEPGGIPLWNPRPAYYYMYYFQKYFGDRLIASKVTGNDSIVTYASSFGSGEAGIVVVNTGKKTHVVRLDINNFEKGKRYYLHTINGGNDNGEFSLKVYINGTAPAYAAGGPAKVESIKAWSAFTDNEIKFDSPGRSVQYILVENK